MPFISLAVTALEVIVIGYIRTSTPKFLFAETMNTTSRFSMLALTDFAFPAPANFILSSYARTVTMMTANSVRSAKIILLKLGKSLIVTVNAFKSATIV